MDLADDSDKTCLVNKASCITRRPSGIMINMHKCNTAGDLRHPTWKERRYSRSIYLLSGKRGRTALHELA
jgi:hypothetical protein